MAHALLSPSSAHRWLNCTPSAKLEEKFPDSSGEAAAEGTLAHRLGELLIARNTGILPVDMFDEEVVDVLNHDLYQAEMYDYMENYSLYVAEQYNNARERTPDAMIYLEQKLNLTDYVPEGFGTGDVVIIADGILDITDLKYGKGVPVHATENKQMMMYSLGALREFEHLYDIHTVRMTIYQPRIDAISSYELSVAELRQWADNTLKPLAKLAFEGKGEFKAGEHCRFCKVKAQCRANAEFNLELAKHDFKKPDLLNEEEVADILNRADLFTKWISAVEEFALAEALNGKKWPGYKLVEGRSNRTYSNEEAVAKTLLDKGYSEDSIYNKKLLGITAMEKTLSKPAFNTLLGDYIVKPPGKPSLVPESDKRPEYNSTEAAAKDFASV